MNYHFLHQLSPLHKEARQGDLKKVKSLIHEGADINLVDPDSKVSRGEEGLRTRPVIFVNTFCGKLLQ